MKFVLILSAIWYTSAHQTSRAATVLTHRTALNTSSCKEPEMPEGTLPAPSPIVQIQNGDPGVTYRETIHSPDYAIGDDGNVWTRTNGKWCRMKLRVTGSYGHLSVSIKGRPRSVHRLVLEAFVGPCPTGMECRHFPDRDPANNSLTNLQWGTHADNMRDRIAHGTTARGSEATHSKLSPADVKAIVLLLDSGEKVSHIAQKFGISNPAVHMIDDGRSWSEVTGRSSASRQDRIDRFINHYSKLNKEQVREIKSLFGSMRSKDIAAKFGVSQQTVCDIKHGRHWTST